MTHEEFAKFLGHAAVAIVAICLLAMIVTLVAKFCVWIW